MATIVIYIKKDESMREKNRNIWPHKSRLMSLGELSVIISKNKAFYNVSLLRFSHTKSIREICFFYRITHVYFNINYF